jgi:peptidoglycan hydrolase-like protein with peptidoglycan-binding domain
MKTLMSRFVMVVAGLAIAATAHAQTGGGPSTTSPAMPGPTQPSPSGTNKPAGTDRDASTSAPSAAPSTSDATRPDTTGKTGKMDTMKSKRSADAMKPAGAGHGDRAMRGERVRALQQALKDKGHDPGDIDGVMGPKTRQALRDFQQKEGLTATGRLDSGTADKLGIPTQMGSADQSSPSASPRTSAPGASDTTSSTGTASGPMSAPPASDRDAAKGGMDKPGQTRQPQTK